jgi:hypothetical protein
LTGIAIEGVGTDTTKTDGLFLFYSGGDLALHTSSNREGRAALRALPQGTSTRVNPYTGDVTTNALAFEVSASNTLAPLLMSEQRRAPYTLGADLTDSATTVNIGTVSLDNLPIWIGDETILLGTDSGSGVYTGCTRGLWGSPAQAHDAGDGVYRRVPGWADRLITVIEHDEADGSETVVGRYHIDNISMDDTIITIQTSEVLNDYRAAEINQGAEDLTAYAKSMRINPNRSIAGALVGYTSTLRQANTSLDAVFLEVNGERIHQFVQRDGLVNAGGNASWVFEPYPFGEDEVAIDSLYEVFVIWRQSGSGSNVVGDFSTEDLTYPAHPLAIALALLTSTGAGYNGSYDVLGEQWGLGLDYISWTPWETEIANTPDMCIDQLVLGRGGSTVNVFTTIQDILLKPFGYFLSITNDGLLTIERLRLPTLIDWQAAQTSSIDAYIDGPLRMDRAMGEISDRIVANVGGAGTGQTTTVNVRTPERSTRRAKLADAREFELNYTAINPKSLGIVPGAQAGALTNALVNLLQLNLDAVPRLFVRVGNPATTGETDYNHGRIIRINDLANLQDAWIVDANGNRVDDLSEIDFAGMIIGREYDLDRRTYTLELLFLSYHVGQFIRLRAPSGVIASVDSGTNTITLDATTFSASDAATFNDGDDIEIWTVDGAKWASSVVRSVDNVSGNNLELDAWFGADPSAGMIVRLANSASYNNTSIYSLTGRPYTYLADANDEIDENGTTVDADIYGTNIYGGAFNTNKGLEPDFIGIDDESFDTTSSDCPPLDTWLEHRLRANAQHLITQGNQVSWAPLSGRSNDLSDATGKNNIRPYASINTSTIMFVPWLIEPGLKQVSIHGIGRVGDEGGTNSYITKLRLDTQQLTGEQEYIEVLANTEADTPEFQPFEVALSYDTAVQFREVAPLELWGNAPSQNNATAGSASLGSGDVRGPILYSDANFYADSAATRPNTSALDTMYTVPGAGNAGVRMDHMQTRDYGSDEGMVTYPPPVAASTVQKYYMSYLQLRGLEVQQTFQDTTAQAKSELEAGKPELGEIAGLHIIRTNAVQKRAKPLWIGPRGQAAPSEDGWPTGYTTRFARIAGDATDTAVFSANVFPSTDNCTLLVMAYVLPCFDQTIYNRGSLFGLVEEESIEGHWNIGAKVHELQTGEDWSTATELGNSLDTLSGNDPIPLVLQHLPFDLTGQIPALLTEFMVRKGIDSANGFAMKEGQLFAPDIPYLTLVQTTVDITRDASGELPCRVQLHLDYDTRDTANYFNNTDTDLDTSDALITVVGASIWELPQ